VIEPKASKIFVRIAAYRTPYYEGITFPVVGENRTNQTTTFPIPIWHRPTFTSFAGSEWKTVELDRKVDNPNPIPDGYTIIAYGLPLGLSIDPDTGVISGTAPMTPGRYEFVTVARNSTTGSEIWTEIRMEVE
jgi:hypothetical protein